MSTFTKYTALTSASDESVDYWKLLFTERFGTVLTDDVIAQYGDQPSVSGAIKALLQFSDESKMVPADPAAQARVLALGTELGMTIVPANTQAGVNRQLRELEKSVDAKTRSAKNEAKFGTSQASFAAFLDALAPTEGEDAIAF